MNKKTQQRTNKFLIEILKTKCSIGSFGNGNKWNSQLALCWCIKYRKYEDFNSDFAKIDVFVEKNERLFPKVILFIFSAIRKCLRQINFISYILLHYSYIGFYLWNLHFNDFLIKSFFLSFNQNTMEINNAIVICIIPTENLSLSFYAMCDTWIYVSKTSHIPKPFKVFPSIDIGLM